MSRRKRGAAKMPDVALPIIPMLDMAFQLLMFFIFNFNPSSVEGQMAVLLPTDKDAQAPKQDQIKVDQVPKSDDLPEPVIELLILVKPSDQGGENPITIEENAIRTSLADLGALKKHLKALFDRRKEAIEAELAAVPADKQDEVRKEKIAKIGIKVQPISAVKWGEMVKVMDACRASGFTSVSFSKPSDYRL